MKKDRGDWIWIILGLGLVAGIWFVVKHADTIIGPSAEESVNELEKLRLADHP